METQNQHQDESQQQAPATDKGDVKKTPSDTELEGNSDDTSTGETPPGYCKCDRWPTDKLPQVGSLRRLFNALEAELQGFEDAPTDASKELAKDLEDCEKEFQGMGDLIQKYEAYFCQIDCDLKEVDNQAADITGWCEGVSEATRKKIRDKLWAPYYDSAGKALECDWLRAKDTFDGLQNCLEWAKIDVTQAKDDLEEVKGFEAALKKRFANLKSLHGDAKTRLDTKEYKAICAIGLEFEKNRANLGHLEQWKARRDRCQTSPNPAATPGVKTRTPDWLRSTFVESLRTLILAKYQKFCWHQHWLDTENQLTQSRERLDAFLKKYRERLIQEAEDVEEATDSQAAAAS